MKNIIKSQPEKGVWSPDMKKKPAQPSYALSSKLRPARLEAKNIQYSIAGWRPCGLDPNCLFSDRVLGPGTTYHDEATGSVLWTLGGVTKILAVALSGFPRAQGHYQASV